MAGLSKAGMARPGKAAEREQMASEMQVCVCVCDVYFHLPCPFVH